MGFPIAIAGLGLLLQVPAPHAADQAVVELREEYRATIDAEAKSLTRSAEALEKAGKVELARSVRDLIEPKPAGGTRIFRPLLDVVAAREGHDTAELPADVRKLRSKTASAIFGLAKHAAGPAVKNFALTDACLRGVLARDPDHAEARRLLGYLPYKGGWATPQAKTLLEAGSVPHPTFGWVDRGWVAHLDAGDLPAKFDAKGKPIEWKPADQVDALHATWDKAWKIKTAPHFEVTTDVALSEAIAFGRRLEGLYELFSSDFADVIGPERLPLAQRFANPALQPVASTRKFQVCYFASKKEYVDFFRTKFDMQEDLSLGYYMPPQQAAKFKVKVEPRSYFYKDEKYPIAAHATLYHEASHQILFESAKSGVDSTRPNFWIWEGLGTYFETVTPREDGSIAVGTPAGPRMDQARTSLLKGGKFVPLDDFAAMNKEAFNDLRDDAVYRNYAEAMAWTVFFLHGEKGRYREEYLSYLADAYRGRNRSRTLSDRLGVASADLDAQFLAFLKSNS